MFDFEHKFESYWTWSSMNELCYTYIVEWPDLQWHWIDPNFSFSWATFCLVQHVASACVRRSFNEWSASNSLPSCFKVKTWTTFARLAQNTLCLSLSCFVSFGFKQVFFLWISAALGSFDRPGNKRSVGTIGCRFFLKKCSNLKGWKWQHFFNWQK